MDETLARIMPHIIAETITNLTGAVKDRVMQCAMVHPYLAALQLVNIALTPFLGTGCILRLVMRLERLRHGTKRLFSATTSRLTVSSRGRSVSV
ncbi:hypothetical protein RBB50_003822 [Rhinocladiella similis]